MSKRVGGHAAKRVAKTKRQSASVDDGASTRSRKGSRRRREQAIVYAPDRERRRHGIVSMLDLPLLVDASVPPVDVLLFGVPNDSGTLQRKGASLGPSAVRQASWIGGRFSSALGVDIYAELKVVDGGDVATQQLCLEDCLSAAAEKAASVARSGAVVGAVGGDQSVTLANLRGLRAAKKRAVGLIHIDAFHDAMNDVKSGLHHRNVIRQAADEGLVRMDSAMQIGLRGPCDSAEEQEFAFSKGFELITMDEVRWDFHSVVSQVRKMVSRGSLYVSVDLCALDPSVAPGVSTPAPGGMSMWQLQQLLRALVGADIVGFDVVELCPVYDFAELSAGVASVTLQEILSAIADTRRSGRPAASAPRSRRGRRSA